VISASAKKVMSEIKLIKTRLRSVMSDDYLWALMPLAAGEDEGVSIAYDSIINRLARISPALENHLFPCNRCVGDQSLPSIRLTVHR
jgi:hypothetical protein